MLFFRKKEGVFSFSAKFAMFAMMFMALLGLFNQTPVQPNAVDASMATFSTVTTQPTERPPEADNSKLTISPEIALASAETYQPVSGVITSGYGMRNGTMHDGVDIAGPIGDPIVSMRDGVVIQAGPAQGYGQWIVVRQDDGRVVEYGHIESILASAGQRVNAGQQIATRGNRGESTGPHLHLRVRGEDPSILLSMAGISAPPVAADTTVVSLTPAPAPVQSGRDWDHLAMCESSGDWAINTGNGYYGGLQFDIPTWNEYGGQQYASRADFATRDQQVAIADKVLVARGGDENAAIRTWPGCSTGKANGWWLGGGSSAPVSPAPAPAPVVEAPAPTWNAPEAAPVQEPIVETLPAPAQTWVDNAVESLPEPVQAPVQQWIDEQTVQVPAPAYTAPVMEAPQFDAAPAPSLPAFDANAVVGAVTNLVNNTPALSDNPAIAGAVAQLPGLLGIG